MTVVPMTAVTMTAVAMTTDMKCCDRMDINSVNNVNGLMLRLLTDWKDGGREGRKIFSSTCFTSKNNHPRGRLGMNFWPF